MPEEPIHLLDEKGLDALLDRAFLELKLDDPKNESIMDGTSQSVIHSDYYELPGKHSNIKYLITKSGFKYLLIIAVSVISVIIYSISKKTNTASSIKQNEKQSEIPQKTTVVINDPAQKKGEKILKQNQPASQNYISDTLVKKLATALNLTNAGKNSDPIQHDSLKGPVKQAEAFLDIDGVDRGIFYHISGAEGTSDRNRHALFWYTHKELPNTYFVIEQLCWNKWVTRGKVIAGKGRPGRGNYSGKIPDKFLYKFKIPSHSGENGLRVVLMNDSNACLAVSKELKWTSKRVAKVSYTINKRNKEIRFSNDTYYELYNTSGEIVDQGSTRIISYATFEKGIYILNFDNSTATIKLK